MTFYIHKDKLKVLPIGVEVPNNPTTIIIVGGQAGRTHQHKIRAEYERLLQSVRCQGIEVKNEDYVRELIENSIYQGDTASVLLKEGEFYSLPDEEFEMEVKDQFRRLDDCIEWIDIGGQFERQSFNEYRQLAIIKPKSKPEDETLEEMDSKFSEASKKLMKSRPSKTYEVKPVEDEQEENRNWNALARIVLKHIIHTGPSATFDSASFEDEAKEKGFTIQRKPLK